MSSREVITRVIERRDAPRIGFQFNRPHEADLEGVFIPFLTNDRYSKWGRYPELLEKVPDFQGEVMLDELGNIVGRLNEKTKGECIRGVLEEEWEGLETYEFPGFDEAYLAGLKARNYRDSDKFVAATSPLGVFSTLRDMRLMDNALADTILEPETVALFLEKVQKVLMETITRVNELGMQALWLYDDWGMQHAPFISPESFRSLFKPVYKAVADQLHERGMKFIVHSCGLVWDFIPDFMDAGIDVLQFDQPELSGSENLARAFGNRATLFSPVDIQKVMPTGDRELIEESARNMMRAFRTHAGGGLIAMDYASWQDIDVKEEWADWARNVFLSEGWNR